MSRNYNELFFDKVLSLTDGNKVFVPIDGLGHESLMKIGNKYKLYLECDKVVGNIKQRCSINYSNEEQEQIFIEKGIIMVGKYDLYLINENKEEDGLNDVFEARMFFAVPEIPNLNLDDGVDYLLFNRTRRKDKIDLSIELFKQFGYHHVFTNNFFY